MTRGSACAQGFCSCCATICRTGHACLPQDKLCGAASGFLGVEPETVASTLAFMLENNDLCAVEYREKSMGIPA